MPASDGSYVASGKHDREALERLVDRDYRQVWAVHRTENCRIFLNVGQADAVRDEAKALWKCPVPGCDGPISTRGKSRRDHFFHPSGASHGEGESEWHLQAKAMIAGWAEQQPGRVSVREEETAKDEATRMHRIADVMVTWPDLDGRKIAFEVEYKPYTAEDWRTKDGEYAAVGIGVRLAVRAPAPLPVPAPQAVGLTARSGVGPHQMDCPDPCGRAHREAGAVHQPRRAVHRHRHRGRLAARRRTPGPAVVAQPRPGGASSGRPDRLRGRQPNPARDRPDRRVQAGPRARPGHADDGLDHGRAG